MSRVRWLMVLMVVVASLATTVPAFAAPPATAAGPGCSAWYTVQPHDNMYRIALRFGTSVWALARLNGIANPNILYAGQVLCVRAGAPIPFGFLYQVKRGDTLYSIATRYGWSVSYLAMVNHLPNPCIIWAGQVLLIPYHR